MARSALSGTWRQAGSPTAVVDPSAVTPWGVARAAGKNHARRARREPERLAVRVGAAGPATGSATAREAGTECRLAGGGCADAARITFAHRNGVREADIAW